MTGGAFSRRDFLRLTGGGALLAAAAGCRSGSRTEATASGGGGRTTLRIAQWNNDIAGYDRWWDEEYTRQWGERNDVEVMVESSSPSPSTLKINRARSPSSRISRSWSSLRSSSIWSSPEHLRAVLSQPPEPGGHHHPPALRDIQVRGGEISADAAEARCPGSDRP